MTLAQDGSVDSDNEDSGSGESLDSEDTNLGAGEVHSTGRKGGSYSYEFKEQVRASTESGAFTPTVMAEKLGAFRNQPSATRINPRTPNQKRRREKVERGGQPNRNTLKKGSWRRSSARLPRILISRSSESLSMRISFPYSCTLRKSYP